MSDATTRIETLRDLLARVVAATEPDRDLDLAIAYAIVPDVVCGRYNRETGRNEAFTYWKYTDSIDAAVALAERVLPACGMFLGIGRVQPQEPKFGCVIRGAIEYSSPEIGYGEHDASLPLATLAAIFSALIAQEGE